MKLKKERTKCILIYIIKPLFFYNYIKDIHNYPYKLKFWNMQQNQQVKKEKRIHEMWLSEGANKVVVVVGILGGSSTVTAAPAIIIN